MFASFVDVRVVIERAFDMVLSNDVVVVFFFEI